MLLLFIFVAQDAWLHAEVGVRSNGRCQALPKPEEAEDEEEEAAAEVDAGPIEPEELAPLRPVNEWTMRGCPASGTVIIKSLKWSVSPFPQSRWLA